MDTNFKTCKRCEEEKDCINGLCQECFLKNYEEMEDFKGTIEKLYNLKIQI